MVKEPNIEPENQTKCEATGGKHCWIWDEDIEDWFCDECGVLESNQ